MVKKSSNLTNQSRFNDSNFHYLKLTTTAFEETPGIRSEVLSGKE